MYPPPLVPTGKEYELKKNLQKNQKNLSEVVKKKSFSSDYWYIVLQKPTKILYKLTQIVKLRFLNPIYSNWKHVTQVVLLTQTVDLGKLFKPSN